MLIYQPPPGKPSILFANEQLLVVYKPAGLLTVPGRGQGKDDCLISRLREDYPQALIVHRLDMSTSGIVVLGLGPGNQRALSILFQERRVEKRYQALVEGGWVVGEEGDIRLPLIADWPRRPRQKVDHLLGRPSHTRYRVLAVDKDRDVSRVELEPLTGRSHQLRVHLEAVGHPILGDELYGTEKSRAKADRLTLHACAIRFADPKTGATIAVDSPPPF